MCTQLSRLLAPESTGSALPRSVSWLGGGGAMLVASEVPTGSIGNATVLGENFSGAVSSDREQPTAISVVASRASTRARGVAGLRMGWISEGWEPSRAQHADQSV